MERQLQEELLVTVINKQIVPKTTRCREIASAICYERPLKGLQNATVVEIPPFSAMILEKIN